MKTNFQIIMNGQIVITLLLLAVFVFGQNKPNDTTEGKPPVFGKEYLPLNESVNYIYDSSIGEAELEIEEKNKGYKITYNGSGIEYSQVLKYNGENLTITKTENEVFFFGTEITYGEPMLKIPFPVKNGDKWSWEGLQIIDEDTTTIYVNGSVLGTENLTTKAGNFDALKLYYEINSGEYTDRITEWYGKDIGLIKSEAIIEGGGFTGALQSILGLDKIVFELKEIKED